MEVNLNKLYLIKINLVVKLKVVSILRKYSNSLFKNMSVKYFKRDLQNKNSD